LQVGIVGPDRELVILAIDPGPARRWNDDLSHHFGLKKFRPGDRIMRVATATECDDMVRELFEPQSSPVKIEVRASTCKEADMVLAKAVPVRYEKTQDKHVPQQLVLPLLVDGGFSEFAFAAAVALSQKRPSEVHGKMETDAATTPHRLKDLEGEQYSYDVFELTEVIRTSSERLPQHAPAAAVQKSIGLAKSSLSPLPSWLSPQLFGPTLQAAICDLSASDGFSLLEQLALNRASGFLWQAIYNELHQACTNDAGQGIWSALLFGASCDDGARRDPLEWQSWREALWRIGLASLRQKHDEIANLLREWCTQSISAEWSKQLVGIEEAMGWCFRHLDSLRTCRSVSPSPQYMNTVHAERLLTAGHWKASLEGPHPKTDKRLILQPILREDVRSLEADRSRAIHLQRHIRLSEHRRRVAADCIALDTESAVSSCISDGSCIPFNEFRHILDGAVSSNSATPCQRPIVGKNNAPRISASVGNATPRWRELRVF